MANDFGLKITMMPSALQLKGMFEDINLKQATQDEIISMLYIIESYAKQLSPVKTGRLRASINTTPLLNEIGGSTQTDTDYAIFVDQGTRYMRARPFMETALGLLQPSIEGKVASRLDREITDKFKAL